MRSNPTSRRLTVVGTGIHHGVTEAYVATIPEPSTLVLAAASSALILSILFIHVFPSSRRALARGLGL